MPDRPNVFISSTMNDLADYRRAASDAVIEAGMFPIWLEAIATPGNIFEIFVDLLERSEVVIGIYAHWYGNFPEKHDISWIEFESNFAVEHKKLYLPLMIEDNYPWNPDFYENRQPHKAKLQAFKTRLWQNQRVLRFTDVPSLKAQIVQTLQRKPFSEIGMNRIVTSPIWGVPPAYSQYDADIFMAMPFRPQQLHVYDNCIKKVVASQGMSIKRGDDFFTDKAVMNDVWSAIYHAELVIADCTGRNTNVFYELGIAHTLGKPTIILAQNGDDIPFDLRHLRYLIYDPENLDKLSADLSAAMQQMKS